jgi:hypothetical protein
LSTHMVHQAIITAGKAWTNLRIQEVQGMCFLCPRSSPSYPLCSALLLGRR